MAGELARGLTFGQAATEYERIRPGYPAALVDAVLSHCGGPDTTALEVGAGTGKATRAFAARGLRITAVEPDPAMARVLAASCAAYPGVTVVVRSFEDYVPDAPCGLLFSAQAWHWTDPEVRWQRVAAALAPAGSLALFWNFDRIADPATQAGVTEAHRAITPHIEWETDAVAEDSLLARMPGPELSRLRSVTGVEACLYRWERVLTRQQYLDYLFTHSPYLALGGQVRERLFARIGEALPDRVVLAEDTVLYLATHTPA